MRWCDGASRRGVGVEKAGNVKPKKQKQKKASRFARQALRTTTTTIAPQHPAPQNPWRRSAAA
jgi:hypothetical protein